MPVNSGRRPVLPPGGHSSQGPPPAVLEERAAPPADAPACPPPPELPEPLDPLPLADEPDAALPELLVPLAETVGVVAFPEAGRVGRAIAPPPAG